MSYNSTSSLKVVRINQFEQFKSSKNAKKTKYISVCHQKLVYLQTIFWKEENYRNKTI